MEISQRCNNYSYYITFSVRGTIEHECPSLSWFGSFFGAENIEVSDEHDVLIEKVKFVWLVTLHRLMGKVVRQDTPLMALQTGYHTRLTIFTIEQSFH